MTQEMMEREIAKVKKAKAGLWDQAMQQMKWLAGKDLRMVDATRIKVHRDGAKAA